MYQSIEATRERIDIETRDIPVYAPSMLNVIASLQSPAAIGLVESSFSNKLYPARNL